MSRGTNRERAVKALLEEGGWFVVRAPASLGSADLLASRHNKDVLHVTPLADVLLVQVKSDHQDYGPFNNFGPKDRAELLADAEKAGGTAVLAYWPPRGKLTWIQANEWPGARLEAA